MSMGPIARKDALANVNQFDQARLQVLIGVLHWVRHPHYRKPKEWPPRRSNFTVPSFNTPLCSVMQMCEGGSIFSACHNRRIKYLERAPRKHC